MDYDYGWESGVASGTPLRVKGCKLSLKDRQTLVGGAHAWDLSMYLEDPVQLVFTRSIRMNFENYEGANVKLTVSVIPLDKSEIKITKSTSQWSWAGAEDVKLLNDFSDLKSVEDHLFVEPLSKEEYRLVVHLRVQSRRLIGCEAELNSIPSPSPLENMLKTAEFSDVTVRAGEREFRVHRSVMAAQSDVFKAMFSTDMVERNSSVVTITDLSSEAVDSLLKCMYGIDPRLVCRNVEVAVDLLLAADKYNVKALRERVDQLLSSTRFSVEMVPLETGLRIFLLGTRLKLRSIQVQGVEIIRERSQDIYKSPVLKKYLEDDEVVKQLLYLLIDMEPVW